MIKAQWQRDAAFGDRVMHTYPPGTAIYQLPYVPFPEGVPPAPVAGSYDGVRGYLHTTGLRWSYGAMRGRPQDVGADIADVPLDRQIPALVAGGFAAFWVDDLAYPDGGRATRADLQRLLGTAPATSADGRFAVFDARPYASRLRARVGAAEWAALAAAIQHPVAFRWATGTYADQTAQGPRRWLARHAEITVTNLGDRPRRIRFDGILSAPGAARAAVRVATSLSPPAQVVATPAGVPVHLVLSVPPGASSIVVEDDAPAIRDAYGRDLHVSVTRAALFDASLG